MTQRISFRETPKGLLDGLMKTEFYMKKSGLDPKLVELMKYRVSQINGCAYCLDMHHKEAISLGEEEIRLHSLAAWKESPYYDDKERVVFEFAEAVTFVDRKEVGDSLYTELSAHFTKEEIADLTVAVAQINSWNRINKTFRTMPGNYRVGQF